MGSEADGNKPEGKPRPSLVEPSFIMAMASIMELGLKNGRQPGDWKDIPRDQALEQYRDALLRHAFAEDESEDHLAAVACNAMILWWHRRQET